MGVPRRNVYHLLSNPIDRGQLTHKGEIIQGEHNAIVDEGMWEQVQSRLRANASGSSRRRNINQPSLLSGLVTDQHDRAMTPSQSGKIRKTPRYRYYVTRPDPLGNHLTCRLPDNDLEPLYASNWRCRSGMMACCPRSQARRGDMPGPFRQKG